MAINNALKLLKATADPSRLRLLALLASGEATVGELVEVLGQSQPRVSRHLKILSDARLVSHFRDGQWVYYRLDPAVSAAELAERIVSLARARDEMIARDQARMTGYRPRPRALRIRCSDRSEALGGHAARTARRDRRWARLLRRHWPTCRALVRSATCSISVWAPARCCACWRRAPAARWASTFPRACACWPDRACRKPDLGQCTIRAGDMHALPFPDLSFDVVVLDEVLALTDKPQAALAEAARVLRPAGRLLILDRILPAALRLPSARRAAGAVREPADGDAARTGPEIRQASVVSGAHARVRVDFGDRGAAAG